MTADQLPDLTLFLYVDDALTAGFAVDLVRLLVTGKGR